MRARADAKWDHGGLTGRRLGGPCGGEKGEDGCRQRRQKSEASGACCRGRWRCSMIATYSCRLDDAMQLMPQNRVVSSSSFEWFLFGTTLTGAIQADLLELC